MAVHHVREDVGGVQTRREEQRYLEQHLEQDHHHDRAAYGTHAEVDQQDRAEIPDSGDHEPEHERVHHDVQAGRPLGQLEARGQRVAEDQQVVQLLPHRRLADQVDVREIVAVRQAVAEDPDHDPADLHDRPGAPQQQEAHSQTGEHYENVTSFDVS
jgi:hypothetical protein